MDKVKPSFNDEINIFDLIRIISKRKWLIISIWVFLLVLAGIYTLNTKPIYQSTAKIFIGEYPFLNSRYGENIRIDSRKFEPPYAVAAKYNGYPGVSATWNKVQPDIVMFSSKSSDASDAYNHLVSVLNTISMEHDKKYQYLKERLHQQKQVLENNINSIGELLSKLESELKKNKQAQPTVYALMLIERSRLVESRTRAESQLTETVKNEALLLPTKIFQQPVKPKFPIKPNKIFLISITIVVGLLLGLFVAFFVEFISKITVQIRTER